MQTILELGSQRPQYRFKTIDGVVNQMIKYQNIYTMSHYIELINNDFYSHGILKAVCDLYD